MINKKFRYLKKLLNKKTNLLCFKKLSSRREYELLILLTDKFNINKLKFWVFAYGKSLLRFSAKRISVVSKGDHKLAYSINYRSKGTYIRFNFLSSPKYIIKLLRLLKADPNILRFLILNKKENKK